MPHLKILAFVLCLTASFPAAGLAAESSDQSTQETAAAPKCLKAAVNPVTGHAICLEPKGAPVEAPPVEAYQRPCPPRAHDDDPWTIYEHASGCGD